MGTFWQVDFSGQGHGDILAWRHCPIGIFWLRYFNEVDALTYEHISECYFVWCQNLPVHLLKYPCDEIYQSCNIPDRNIYGAKKFLCKTSLCQNCHYNKINFADRLFFDRKNKDTFHVPQLSCL